MNQEFELRTTHQLQTNQNLALRLSNRCDQCSRKCIKCDRLQPSCSQCIRSKISCTFDRKVKNRRALHFLDKNISCFKVEKEQKRADDLGDSATDSSVLTLFMRENGVRILSFQNKYLRPKFDILQKLGRKCLSNLFTLIQFPPKNIFLFVAPSLKALASSFARHNQLHHVLKHNPLETVCGAHEHLYNRAIDSFFQHNGLVLSVCTPITFKKKKRSRLFLQAITIAGLIRLPETNTTKFLLGKLVSSFQPQIENISLLPINFETLQVLVIFHSSLMFFGWARKLSYGLLKYSARIAQILGIQFPNPNLPCWLRLERKLTYNTLLFLDTFSNLVSIPCASHPMFFKSRLITNKINEMISGKSQEIPILQHRDHCCLVYNSFLQDLTYLMFKVFEIKCELSGERIDESSNTRYSEPLLAKTDAICSRAIKRLHGGLFDCDQINSNTITSTIASSINLFSYFLRFFIRSLRFYNIEANKPNDIYAHIPSTIYEATNVLKHAILIHPLRATFLDIAFVSQCLIFLVRYKKFIDNPSVLDRFAKAKSWLNELLRYPSTHFFSSSNVCIIGLIQENFALT